MNITTTLALSYLSKNKKRTSLTLIIILMFTVVITCLLTLFTTYRQYNEMVIRSKGNWEAEFICIKYSDALEIEKNKYIKEVSIYYDYGISDEEFEHFDYFTTQINLKGYDENAIKNSNINIIEGKMSEKSNEIILSKSGIEKINKEIGDEIELTLEGNNKTYTIVGIAEELENEYSYVIGITFLDRNDLQENEIINASILMSNINKIYEITRELEQDLKLYEITNISKITLPDTNIEAIIDEDTIRLDFPTEKIVYNQEILEWFGVYEGNNEQYMYIMLARNNINYCC